MEVHDRGDRISKEKIIIAKKEAVLWNWWDRLMSGGFKLNVKLNRKSVGQPASEPAVAAVTTLLRPLALSWLLWLLSLSLSVSAAASRSSSMSLPESEEGTQGPSFQAVYAFDSMSMESLSGLALTFMLFDLNSIWSFCHTVLIMFIVLSFCLSVFLSLLLLVVVVVFLTRYSFYNFNLSNNKQEITQFQQKSNYRTPLGISINKNNCFFF